MKKVGFLWFALTVVLLSSLKAQEPVLNSNPGDVSWNQVQTPSFRIIYPAGAERKAQHVANLLEKIKEEEASTM
ncbi:MAG: hypothetical protein P8X57_15570, partial [Cyclobacteriaceae bacterium]